MSDVERFYEAARKHFPHARPWSKLHPMDQMVVMEAINMIIGVMNNE